MSDGYVHRTSADFRALLPEGKSGNEVNGLGDPVPRRPRPFFWHPPAEQAFGVLQQAVIAHHRQAPAIAAAYSREADRGPRPAAQAAEREARTPEAWSAAVKAFALANDAELVGITPTRPEYVFEGYDIPYPWLVVIGVEMEYDNLAAAPATVEDPRAGWEVADKYNKAARACRKLANFVLAAGYGAKTYPGPMATALNMIPAAIAAGLGQLGKHGSMINRRYGSSFRLSAIATDLPLVADGEDRFGSEEFCLRCQACTRACPPGAISPQKQLVRGTMKWYVDFDKCIPYFGETFACGICLAACPWSRPGLAPRLAEQWTRRAQEAGRSP